MKNTKLEYDLIRDEYTEHKNIKYLGDIKSLYIIKDIFSYINKKQKLNLIMYNKQLQKIVGVDIEDYKKASGKYKIAEKNGKGREYILNTNILIFEGEYLNWKRNGNGKEYDSDGKLVFEGEYLNGERNGKGKEYDDGKLRFEGEYLNGKIWNGKGYNANGNIEFEINDGKGYIKEYDKDGELEFEGEYLNGKRNGKGKEYNFDGKLEFEGEYLNGERNGKGKEYDYNGELKFKGEYLNGNRFYFC